MSAKIFIRKHIPEGVTLAKLLPQFQDEFAVLSEIVAAGPQPTSDVAVSQEVVDGVSITVTASTFDTVEDAITMSTETKNWPHDNVIAYNKENGVLTFNKIVNEDTDEVVQDWTQRW